MQYVIDYAGSYEGTFAATRSPVRETLYTTRNAALKDLAMVIPGDTEAILKDMVQVKGEEGWYVYLNQEDADADDTGASALALIARAPEAQVTLYSTDMGDLATEEDYDAWVQYVADGLTVSGVCIEVDQMRYNEPGETKVVVSGGSETFNDGEIEQEIKDQLVQLWNAFCMDDSAWPSRS